MKKIFLSLSIFVSIGLFAQKPKAKPTSIKSATTKSSTTPKKSEETIVEITTDFGIMTARLYNNTPLHRDNFIKLVKQGFYDSLLFHRVINGFMIQGGDPSSKKADSTAMLGAGEAPGLPMVPSEFRSNLIHKKGALAAARDNNPEKKSSNCQFYIVQGKKADTAQLKNSSVVYTKDQKEIYQRIGGTPFLDQNYTVFGEVFIGMDVIDKIAATPIYDTDRPVKNVRMKIKIAR
jgi:peptidyl-prolyl cis-trans isomerase B (cyclophilin B)